MRKIMVLAIVLALTAVSNAFALDKADLMNCSLTVERTTDANATQIITLATIYSEISGGSQVDVNEYKNKTYALGYGQNGGGGVSGLRMLPKTTVAVQVFDKKEMSGKTLITLDLTKLIQQLEAGAPEFVSNMHSEKVSIATNETALIRCFGISSRTVLLKSINGTEQMRNRQMLKQISM